MVAVWSGDFTIATRGQLQSSYAGRVIGMTLRRSPPTRLAMQLCHQTIRVRLSLIRSLPPDLGQWRHSLTIILLDE